MTSVVLNTKETLQFIKKAIPLASTHEHVGQPSFPHLYPSWHPLGQERAVVHISVTT